MDWSAVDALKRGLNVPMMVKGITTPEAAQLALQHGVDAIIVSNYDGLAGAATGSVVLTLPAIVDTVGGKVPVLVDGSFRRGTDILEALAFGARGVLVARPAMWGLAAYGADGVRGIVEMLQTELARYMAMCGRPHLKAGPRDRPEDSGGGTERRVHGDRGHGRSAGVVLRTH